MAEKKISQLTAKGATIADTDLVIISESAGGGSYVSKSVTGANIKALVTDANLTTTDITTNNVSTTKHGFAPKLPGNTTTFLRGDGTYATPASGGLTEFTEAENTATPNATVPVNSLTPVTATTNADFALRPKGNGALLGLIPDNAATGGNKRGQYAVDLQLSTDFPTRVASGNYSAIIGGQNNTASGTHSLASGVYSVASGSYSVALGSYSVASGDNYSTAIGNGTASGTFGSVAIGRANTASGVGAVAISGYGCTASGTRSVSMGESCTASGNNSVAIGFETVANAAYSNAQGYQSHTFGIIGRQSYASGQESTSGDSQASKFILRERTTNDTATTLTTNSAGAGTTNQVILSNQSAYRFKGTIIGKKSGTTDIAAWDIDGLIVRGANAAATTLAVSNVTLIQNTPAWGTPTLAADTTNGGLQVQVTGAATTNIQWTAVIETTEVIYA
jgi:hypothetical protein